MTAWVVWTALRKESEDFSKLESSRNATLADKTPVDNFFTQVERVRRVTWRLGIVGAGLLAALLCAMRVVSIEKWTSVVVASWVVVTCVLNFRAYHVEDEGTTVLRTKLLK